MTGPTKITLDATSANGTDTRHILICKGSAANDASAENVLKVLNAAPGTPAAYSYEYEGDAAEIYICSSDGFNLYGIVLSSLQYYKEISAKTCFPLVADNISAATGEGWLVGGATTVERSSSIDPSTGEAFETKTTISGVTVKKGNGEKMLKVYVKGAANVKAIGASTSVDASRTIQITATPQEGEAVVGSAESSEAATVVPSVDLDATKKYCIEVTGLQGDGAGDCVIFGLIFDTEGSSSGIATVKAAKANDAMFNMAGQRVADDFKGLVIKDGKKYVK